MKYKPNREGLIEVLKSGGAQALVHKHAELRRSFCGPGYVASYQMGTNRYRAIVYADSMKAKRSEARENKLLRALG